MWQKIRPLFTGIGILVFLLVAGAITLFVTMGPNRLAPVPSSVALTFKIDAPFAEQRSFDFATQAETPSIHDVVFALRDAADDTRVKAVYVRLSHQAFTLSEVQELKGALNKLHENGKVLKIYSENYAGAGSGIATYYFASFFDEIWLQPTGNTDIAEIEGEMPFFKSALNEVGVTPEIIRAGRYKNAPESFLRDEISPESDAMMRRLFANLYTQAKTDILKNKPNAGLKWDEAVDNSPLTDTQSLELGLISRLGYFDEFDNDLRNFSVANNSDVIDIWDYTQRKSKESIIDNAPQVAFVLLDGVIPEPDVKVASASFGKAALGGGNTIIPQDIENALLDASKREDIKAILIRVNSPGGSPSGSETIRRAIEAAKNNGKKVYVSMGHAAASGGYWVVTDADTVFATPATLTGSIGVYGGKMSVQGLWEKLGIHWDVIAGENPSHFWSPNFKYSEKGQRILENRIQATYVQFIDRVSKGRKIPRDTVQEIAEGQVWTGAEAMKIGLVDQLGGIEDVVSAIKSDLKMAQNDKVALVPFPEPKSTFDQVLMVLGQFFSTQMTFSSALSNIENIATSGTKIDAKMQEQSPF